MRAIISEAEARRANKGFCHAGLRGVPQAVAAGGGPRRRGCGPSAQPVPHHGDGCQEEEDHRTKRAGDHGRQRALHLTVTVPARRSFHAEAAATKDKGKQRQHRQRGSRSWAEYFGSDHVDQGTGVRSFKYFVPRPSKSCTLNHAIKHR